MKVNRWFFVALAVLALVFASLACGVSASTANISNAHMSVDDVDTAQVTSYAPDASSFYGFFDLKNAPDDTVVRGVWTLVSAEGYDSNQEIDSAEITGGDNTYFFTLDRSSDLWPSGQYKLDLYLNDKLAETVNFEVK